VRQSEIGRLRGVLLAAAVLLWGCGETSDSAGADPGDALAARELAAVPEMVLGAEVEAAPEYQLYDVLELLVLQNGDLWVIDGDDRRRIRRFNADGDWLGDVSRQGEGPGETSDPRALAQLPDGTVALLDLGRPGQLLLFAPDGEWLRTHTFDRAVNWAASGAFTADRSGTLWIPVLDSGDEGNGRVWVRADGLGEELTPVVVPDLGWIVPESAPVSEGGFLTAPYTADLHITRGPSGDLWAGWSGAYQIYRIARDESSNPDAPASPAPRVPLITRPFTTPVAVPAAERREAAQALASIAADFGGPDATVPEVPSRKPAYRELKATRGGYLIVRVHTESEFDGEEWSEPSVLEIFDLSDDARYLGRLELEGEQEVLDGGDLRLWTLHRDELGVESIRRYELRPGGSG